MFTFEIIMYPLALIRGKPPSTTPTRLSLVSPLNPPTGKFLSLILLNLIFFLYWVPAKHWAQLQLQVHTASHTHLTQHLTHQRSPLIVFRGHPITLLDSSNMVSLWITRQRSVVNKTSNAKSPVRTTNFATATSRLDIVRHTHVAAAVATGTNVSESMVPPEEDTNLYPIMDLTNSHTKDVPLSTISTAFVDAAIGTSVYKAMVPPDVRLSTIATASVAVSNRTSVYDAMVSHIDDQSKQHTYSTPPSHHRAKLLLRPAYVVCAAYKYCSIQSGNIIFNNIALDQHGGWKAIYDYDHKGKNA